METRDARHAPGSFFRSGNHCPALFRSPVLSCLGNSSAQQSSAQRTTVFDVLRPHAPRPKPSTRLASRPRILFPPLEPQYLTLSVHPPPLPWGNSPPDRSPSGGQACLIGFQTPAPVTRLSRRAPWEGGPTEEGESVHTTLRARAYAYMRAPASTRKRTIQKQLVVDLHKRAKRACGIPRASEASEGMGQEEREDLSLYVSVR